MFSVYYSGGVWEIDVVPALGRNKLTSDGHVNSLLTNNKFVLFPTGLLLLSHNYLKPVPVNCEVKFTSGKWHLNFFYKIFMYIFEKITF